MSELFRREAIRTDSDFASGEVRVTTSRLVQALSWTMIITVVALTLLLAFGSYARKETIEGVLLPERGLINLPGRDGGIVAEVHANVGDILKPGDPIATIQLTSGLATGDPYGALTDILTQTQVATAARAKAEREKLDVERRQVADSLARLRRSRSEYTRRIELQVQRVAIAQSEVERARSISEQGYLPRREVELRESARLAAEQELSEMRLAAEALQQEIAESESRLATIPIEMRRADADTQLAAAEIATRNTEAEISGRFTVRATVPGVLLSLPFRQGQAVSAASTVAVLAPTSSRLIAELWAPAESIGFVVKGQEVRLMYRAFPFAKFGTGRGTVEEISRVPIAIQDLSLPGAVRREQAYRVTVGLDKGALHAYGNDIALQPGMKVDAVVVIDRRSLLEWLLDPLYAAGRRS